MPAMRERRTAAEGDIVVTQVRSTICTKPKHRGTLRALGLRGIGATNILPDRPEIRGMIARVPHLVRISSYVVETEAPTEVATRRSRKRAASPAAEPAAEAVAETVAAPSTAVADDVATEPAAK